MKILKNFWASFKEQFNSFRETWQCGMAPRIIKYKVTDFGYRAVIISYGFFLRRCKSCGEKTNERVTEYELDGRTGGWDGPPDFSTTVPQHFCHYNSR